MSSLILALAIFTNVSDIQAPETFEPPQTYISVIATYEDEYYSYEPYYVADYVSDGFQSEGVRDYNGRTETWYSSNTLYHYRTNEWSVDSEGYYRDSEGRYIVAASDVPEGTEIETSKGTGIVSDSGCDDGVTDFYVAW